MGTPSQPQQQDDQSGGSLCLAAVSLAEPVATLQLLPRLTPMLTPGTMEDTTAMDSATMVATTDWDTMDTGDTTDTGAGRRGLLTPPLLLTPRLTPTTTLTDWVTTDWDTAWDTTEVTATTCTERGLLTLLLTL